jgi:hypothetical protein
MRALRELGPGYADLGIITPLLSAAIGFIFAARVMSRPQKVIVGLFYFPTMFVVLTLFSLGVIGYLYGDWI